MLFISCIAEKKEERQIITQCSEREFVPKWSKSAIWYQIFPERFRDGDPSNNPTVFEIQGADPKGIPAAWNVHPWGSDWYELQPYEKQNGDADLWKHLSRRRYGGDIQGVIDKLDYLSDLGINAIYFNPLFDAPSSHKYDGKTYHHIDPNFGPDPEGDRALMIKENPIDVTTWVWTKADLLALDLIKQAHAKGIRIIFDGVFNHLGYESFAFQDVIKNQQKSAYKDWFTIKSWDDPTTIVNEFDYECWFGAKSLPELREDSTGIVAGPKEYIFNATKRWMNPMGNGIENGIDGWRLDVAFCVGHNFWKQWRKHVRSINPTAYLTAEIVEKPEKVIPYMQGDEFDGEMNYNFAVVCTEYFFNPDSIRISSTIFNSKLKELRDLYPQGVAYASMNLFGSHDTNRIGSHILNIGIENFRNWSVYFGASKATENYNYNVSKPSNEDVELQKLFVIMQMTYVGAPMIYYGDEVGMWGSNDPDCRKPMLWADVKYENERFKPDGFLRPPDSVKINKGLLEHYKKLIKIRKEHEALQLGDFKLLIASDEKDIFAFSRRYEEKNVVVILNNARETNAIHIPDISGCYVDILNNETLELSKDKNESLSLAPKWGKILVPCSQ